jgi:1,4-dihydroxy-2-naphthoate octaprenyltransferase
MGRPQFLIGGFVFYGLGATVAAWAGARINLRLYAEGQLIVTVAQLMTHYCNDHFDYEADRANGTPTRWSGGSRVLQSGALPHFAALVAALILLAIGIAASIHLLASVRATFWLPTTLASMLLLSWGYSAPPFRLHSTGWGELVVALVVTGIVPFTGYFLQAPHFDGFRQLFLALIPLALLQFAMIVGIAFPDAAGDAMVGKRTLVVRLGGPRAAKVYGMAVILPYLTLPWLVVAGLPYWVAVATGIASPFGFWRGWRVWVSGDWNSPQHFEGLAFWSVALLVITTFLELAAFLTLLAVH